MQRVELDLLYHAKSTITLYFTGGRKYMHKNIFIKANETCFKSVPWIYHNFFYLHWSYKSSTSRNQIALLVPMFLEYKYCYRLINL